MAVAVGMNEAFDDGRFAGIRDESFFFAPLASNSALMISAKQVFYMLCAAGIVLLVGFDRLHDVFLVLAPFSIFMTFYTHKGVHMEYVLYYIIIFLISWKKEKKDSKKIQKKKTSTLFSSRSFGATEKNVTKKTTTHTKKIKPIKVHSFDEPVDLELDVGIANRLRYVDVKIGTVNVATHIPVESDGTLCIVYVPRDNAGTILVKVMQSGTASIIASENIVVELIT